MRENVPRGRRRVGADPVAPGARLGADDGAIPGHQAGSRPCAERWDQAESGSVALLVRFRRLVLNATATPIARHIARATISLQAMAQVFPFSDLATADLFIDAIYEGGARGNTGDDVLGKLIPGAGNQGGFRQVGSWETPSLAILYSSMDDQIGRA